MTQKSMLWRLELITRPPPEVKVISPAGVTGRLVAQLLGSQTKGQQKPLHHHPAAPLRVLARRPRSVAQDPG